MYHYNDSNTFRCNSFEDIKDKVQGFILIPIRYDIDGYENISIDTLGMKEEFERTVYGIESVIEELYENKLELKGMHHDEY